MRLSPNQEAARASVKSHALTSRAAERQQGRDEVAVNVIPGRRRQPSVLRGWGRVTIALTKGTADALRTLRQQAAPLLEAAGYACGGGWPLPDQVLDETPWPGWAKRGP